MKILVCVKHVPKESEMKLDPTTKTLVRGGEGEISSMDKYALELAVRLKEKHGGSITAVTMGIPAAAASLKYAISVGADDVYLLSDRVLGGSDAYATAVALSAAVTKLESESGEKFDLVVCGKQASDSDTSLVTPALAELLGRPHTTAVIDSVDDDESSVTLCREQDEGSETLKLPYPAVISIGKTVFPARYPNLRLKLAANRISVPVLTATDLGLEAANVGQQGSLTDVGRSFVPEHDKIGVRLDGENSSAAAGVLIDMLRLRHVI